MLELEEVRIPFTIERSTVGRNFVAGAGGYGGGGYDAPAAPSNGYEAAAPAYGAPADNGETVCQWYEQAEHENTGYGAAAPAATGYGDAKKEENGAENGELP